MLGYATAAAVLARVLSLFWDSDILFTPLFNIITLAVAGLVIFYFRRRHISYPFKLYTLLGILFVLFTLGLFNRALFSVMGSLLVTTPIIFSYMGSRKLAVGINMLMLAIFLIIGGVIIYRTGLNIDPEAYFKNPLSWLNDMLIMSFSTLAILFVGRANHRELVKLHQSLEGQQEKLEEQAAELRWRKSELETQVLARSEDLKKTNAVIYESNLQIAEKNLEIAWQNEEMEKTVGEIRKIELDLVESDKLASIGMFAQSISQNITAPLEMIRKEEHNLRKLASAEEPDNKRKLDELTGILSSGIIRIERIIADLGRVSSSDPSETTNLIEVAGQALDVIRPVAKPHIRLTVENLGFPLLVRGNATRIERIFLNLLTNACHALEDNAVGQVTVRFSASSSGITAMVEDNGHGISPENLQKVKEPFFTTKDPGKGTGLGLFLCQSLMHDIGGRLDITSTEGQGTSITLVFPVIEQARQVQ